MSPLESVVACSPATLAGPGGRLLCLQGEPVAMIAEPEHAAALVATVGPEAPLPDLAGALISMRPSGALVVAASDGTSSLALGLHEGRVVSAVGPHNLQSMGTWVVEFHRRYGHARGGRTSGNEAALLRALEPGRTFVVESTLEALQRCDHPGASLLLLQAQTHWLHEQLPRSRAPEFGFLLMEHARRGDELPGIERALPGGGQAVVPLSRPGPSPGVRPQKPKGSEWDFFDDPDPAAESEWLDARIVFDFCDGTTDVNGLVKRAMLGRFRTVSALVALAERDHIRLINDEYADLICDLAS